MFVRTISRSEIAMLAPAVLIVVLLTIAATSCAANPLNLDNGFANRKQSLTVEIAEPEELINSLESLLQQIFQSMDYNRQITFIQQKGNDKKRGIDLGLSRGFSGSQAAKHLMGMQAASFANGPGKRK